jgi:hypothetical protein
VLISVVGPGAVSFANVMNASGIQCAEHPLEMRRDIVSAAGGRFFRITQTSIPHEALAKVLHTWLTLRHSRRVMLTNDHGQVVHAGGLCIAQIERALRATTQIDILDLKPMRGTN